jgi:hypothetical protein
MTKTQKARADLARAVMQSMKDKPERMDPWVKRQVAYFNSMAANASVSMKVKDVKALLEIIGALQHRVFLRDFTIKLLKELVEKGKRLETKKK